MAEQKEGGSEAVQRTPEKRAEEVGVVARAMILEKASDVAKSNKPADQLTPSEGALGVIHKLNTYEAKDFKDKDLVFSGDSLKMRGFSEGGFDFKDGETSVAEITGVTDEGLLICTLRDKNGDTVQRADGTGPQKFGRRREDVIDAQIFSEQGNLMGEFPSEDKQLLRHYFDSMPQNGRNAATLGSEVDDVIEKGAERHGIHTLAEVQAFVDSLDDEQRNDQDIKDYMKKLKAGKIVTAEQFSAIITFAGFDQESMDAKVDSMQEDIDKLEAEKGEIKDDDAEKDKKHADVDAKIAEAQKKKGAFDKAKKVLDDEAAAEDERIAAEMAAEAERQERISTPEADEAIASQIAYLQSEVGSEEAKLRSMDPATTTPGERKEVEDRIKWLKGHLGAMQLASLAKGEAGAFFKRGALDSAIERVGEGSVEGQKLKAIRDGLEDKAKDGKASLIGLAENSGEEQSKIDKMKAAIENSKGNLATMLMDGDFRGLEGFAEKVFGNENMNVDDAREIDRLKEAAISNIADSKGLTEEQKSLLLKTLKGGGWALVIAALLSVGSVAAVVALAGNQK